MRIGFDFDNTIVHYDNLFHKVAREQGVIDDSIPPQKVAIRDSLRQSGKEDIWTEMQGYVYGARMQEADAHLDVIETIRELRDAGHTLAIMSHKTKYPYMGEKYDLHAAARGWIDEYLVYDGQPLIPTDNIYFEVTKEEKLARIEEFGCDVFIDDLPEILLEPIFPKNVKRFLFDPEQLHDVKALGEVEVVTTWPAFASAIPQKHASLVR